VDSASGVARTCSAFGPLTVESAVSFRVLNREELAFAILEINRAVIGYGRRKDLATRRELPLQFAVAADRVQIVVGAAQIHGAILGERGRGVNFSSRGEFSFHFSAGVQRVQVAVIAAEIHGPVTGYGRRGKKMAGK
jgi:hypothetical protein